MWGKVFVICLSLIWISWLRAGSVRATEIDCDDVDAVDEDRIHYCCKHPDGHNDLIEHCANQTGFRLPKRDEEAEVDIPADRLMRGNCFSQCVFDGLKFLKDHKVDMQTVREHFTKNFVDDPEYAKEMIDAFEVCKDAAGEHNVGIILKNFHPQCHPSTSIIFSCVVRRFFHTCPVSRWSSSQECQTALKYRKACPDSFGTF